MDEACRRARPADVPRIVELAHELRRELGPMKGGLLWARREARAEPLDSGYEELVRRDDACVVVGTIDDTVIGFATAVIERLRDGDALGIIQDLYVEADARSVGIGELMVGVLIAFCAEHDCIGIDALALPGHRAAKNFFEGHGFTARSLTMHRPTSSGAASS